MSSLNPMLTSAWSPMLGEDDHWIRGGNNLCHGWTSPHLDIFKELEVVSRNLILRNGVALNSSAAAELYLRYVALLWALIPTLQIGNCIFIRIMEIVILIGVETSRSCLYKVKANIVSLSLIETMVTLTLSIVRLKTIDLHTVILLCPFGVRYELQTLPYAVTRVTHSHVPWKSGEFEI